MKMRCSSTPGPPSILTYHYSEIVSGTFVCFTRNNVKDDVLLKFVLENCLNSIPLEVVNFYKSFFFSF